MFREITSFLLSLKQLEMLVNSAHWIWKSSPSRYEHRTRDRRKGSIGVWSYEMVYDLIGSTHDVFHYSLSFKQRAECKLIKETKIEVKLTEC